ncbi:hypothetical protein [Nocardia terpenica]|uniref:hypothetical protein n=1 Tax=Nocardia terpenica TaxID=455432 RepID=UPI002FE2CD14
MTDVLWADVSEWQVPVDDSYPYPVLAIRSNDGTYRDRTFAQNYTWATRALDDGRLHVLIVYLVYRPGWEATLDTVKDVVGQPHPQTVIMIDVESWGGQINGDQSDGINRLYWGLTDWLGTTGQSGTRRVIGYGNTADLDAMWPTRPDGLALVVAAYGANPAYPGRVAHQYTDGHGYGGGLPEGAPPFGSCDMNSADGYDITALKAALGLGYDITGLHPTRTGDPMATLDQDDINAITASVTKWLADFIVGYVGPIGSDVKDIREQLTGARDLARNPDGTIDIARSFPGFAQTGYRTVTDLLAAVGARTGVPGASDTNPTGGTR